MKKIFTLISMALVAMSVNAQKVDPQGHAEGNYPVKNVVWKAITWTNGNNKKDKDNNDLLYLMGTGNGYATLVAKYSYSDDKSEWQTTPEYTYIDYEKGEKGAPGYGLYYQFTPKVDGALKVSAWVNKGGDNRKVFIVKASDGTVLTPFVDYFFDGYINGKNQEGTNIPLYYSAEEFKTWRDEQNGGANVNPYKLSSNGSAVWGWINLNVKAGESYVIYQQSSQLGFGGYDFTPTGGTAEKYVACIKTGETIALNTEFANVVKDGVDQNGNPVYKNGKESDGPLPGVAQNVTDKGSVVSFGTANMSVEAVGGAEPESVEADFGGGSQKVDKSQKGILIQNGKKFVNK